MTKAKNSQPQLSTDSPKSEIQSISYRIERRDAYQWRPMTVTVFTDGLVIQEPTFKDDLLEVVHMKLGRRMREEGQVEFRAAKQREVEKEAEIRQSYVDAKAKADAV